jgi:hypothetical protein
MTAAYAHHRPAPRGYPRSRYGSGLTLPLIALVALAIAALGYIGYVLWPRWPSPPIDANAPALPVTIAGVAFNVPPGAIRVPIQRQPGAQERLDLAFLWPTLEPPEPPAIPALPTKGLPRPKPLERVFVTIAAARDGLSPDDRVKTIYPRYAEPTPVAGPAGLAVLPFRSGTPYQGEDLIYDGTAPEKFLVRCSRDGAGPTPGICLHASRLGAADVTLRFPRDWLQDWPAVAEGIERLMDKLRPSGG